MENLSLRVEQVMTQPALSAEAGLAILPQGYNPPGTSEGEGMAAFSSILIEATGELSSPEATGPRQEEPSTPQDTNGMNSLADSLQPPSHLAAGPFTTTPRAADPPEGSYSEGLIESDGTVQELSPIIQSGKNSVPVSMIAQADTIMGSPHTYTPPDRSVETAVNQEPVGLKEAWQVETIPSPEPVSLQQGWTVFATGDENMTVTSSGGNAKSQQLPGAEGNQPALPDVSKALSREVKSGFTPHIPDTSRQADSVVPTDRYAERANTIRSDFPHLTSPDMQGKETLPRMAGSYLRSTEGLETSRDSGATVSLHPPLNDGDDQGATRQSHYGEGYQDSNRNNGENFLDLARGRPPSASGEKATVETLNISPLPQSALQQEVEVSAELQGVKAPLSPPGRESSPAPFIHPEIAEAAEPYSARTVMDQIVQRAIPLPGRGNHRIRLALRPDSLGSLELDVSIKNGGVTSHMTTQTVETKELIGANLHLLREALQQHGLHIEQLVISVEQEQSWSEGRTNGSPPDRHDGGKPEEETPSRHGEDTLSSADTDYDLKPWTIDLVV